METPDVPRRAALLNTLKLTIGATLVAIFYPVLKFLRPRPATVTGALEVVAPFKLNELGSTTANPFDFGGKPCLIVLTAEGAKQLASGKQVESSELRAYNAVCTHVDCTVRHRADKGDIYCSCHEGIYDLEGRNVSGPPPRPLEKYLVTLRGDRGQEQIVVSRQS